MRYPERYKDNPRLAKRLARQAKPAARRPLKNEIDQLEVIGEASVKDQQSHDADYWESRAERTRRLAGGYHDRAIRDHFMKIAAGYEELARSTRAVRVDPEKK